MKFSNHEKKKNNNKIDFENYIDVIMLFLSFVL